MNLKQKHIIIVKDMKGILEMIKKKEGAYIITKMVIDMKEIGKMTKEEGKGIIIFIGYEGDNKNEKQEGKGIFYYNNGDKYEGNFKNG